MADLNYDLTPVGLLLGEMIAFTRDVLMLRRCLVLLRERGLSSQMARFPMENLEGRAPVLLREIRSRPDEYWWEQLRACGRDAGIINGAIAAVQDLVDLIRVYFPDYNSALEAALHE